MTAPAFFARLTPTERDDLESRGRRRKHRRGAVLFYEGDDAHDVLFLVSGQVKVSRAATSGRDVILGVFDAGEILGELSAVDGACRSATASALTDVIVLTVPFKEFAQVLETEPHVANELLRTIVSRLRDSSQRQLEFGTADALGRLCRCLVEMADRYGSDEADGRRVTLPLAQHEVAALAGLSREAVVKGLQSLRSLGWIRASGRSVTIVDGEALRARAVN